MANTKRSPAHIRGLQPEVQARIPDLIEQAIIVTDTDGIVAYMNPYAEQAYGWNPQDALETYHVVERH